MQADSPSAHDFAESGLDGGDAVSVAVKAIGKFEIPLAFLQREPQALFDIGQLDFDADEFLFQPGMHLQLVFGAEGFIAVRGIGKRFRGHIDVQGVQSCHHGIQFRFIAVHLFPQELVFLFQLGEQFRVCCSASLAAKNQQQRQTAKQQHRHQNQHPGTQGQAVFAAHVVHRELYPAVRKNLRLQLAQFFVFLHLSAISLCNLLSGKPMANTIRMN
ncbi:MAG: hypothetical protein BWX83_01016 [Candidatus Cloacimonetes bacterium ADurb.Bin117]|nr:MAG: hypothetical protein BWX83_01016 [Candidatus Cloacimonetes bacterium ADurb.Bin117]